MMASANGKFPPARTNAGAARQHCDCVLRPNMESGAIKYFEGRYKTLMRMRAILMEGKAHEEGVDEENCLIGEVFISVQFSPQTQV